MQEARRLIDAAEGRGLPLRALGGVAVAILAGDRLHPALKRPIGDLDLATARESASDVSDFLAAEGYTPDRRFNLLQGARRLLFHDSAHDREADVFVGDFELCHRLPLSERLLLERRTLPLAELVMTKLQIVDLNAKDRGDVYALILTHEVTDRDECTINAARIADLCAADWGLYRTFQLNCGRLDEGLAEVDLRPDERVLVSERLRRIQQAVDRAPKSVKWRMRARVGDRVRWYETPDEPDSEFA